MQNLNDKISIILENGTPLSLYFVFGNKKYPAISVSNILGCIENDFIDLQVQGTILTYFKIFNLPIDCSDYKNDFDFTIKIRD